MALLTAALAAGLLLAGCGDDGSAPTRVDLSASDNGGVISAEVGRRVVLTLESNASTGYEWKLTEEPAADVLAFVSSEYVEGDSDLVGASGTEVWEWTAVGEGSTALRLEYVRPFEPGNVADEFEVTVEVR